MKSPQKQMAVKPKGKGRGCCLRPALPYWEDPVYHYLSRQHRMAVTNGDVNGVGRLANLMQELANRSMPDDVYWGLDAEATADRRIRKQERKKRGKRLSTHRSATEETSPVNVSELKKRIFNPNVSRANVIKAIESLPSRERRATIATLPPGLKKKLGLYLKDLGP